MSKILSQKEIEKHFSRCEFDDKCDVCDNPQFDSYAVNLTNDENGYECDSYICGKCASLSIPNIELQQAKEYDLLVNYLETFKND